MKKYIHELKDWPDLRWSAERLAEQLAAVRHHQGRLIGRMEALGFNLREEAVLTTLTEDVLKSSEIEGAILNKDQVRSSIARRLGLDIGDKVVRPGRPVGRRVPCDSVINEAIPLRGHSIHVILDIRSSG